jgi:alkanesulfonate monooxygenase SsuD/methylene tetrahydromethanopterin reductase-like flavin-dependent oxidoreductase (luciferase family)
MRELGLYTFADVGPGIDPARRLRDLLEEIELADQLGLDVFGVGEHHRPDYAVSSPAVALAAAAARTKRVRLTSAVTVLSSDDRVRVFQDFATLDLISEGRAEPWPGLVHRVVPAVRLRPLRLRRAVLREAETLATIADSERVTWLGRHRAPLEDAGIYPRPLQDPLPVWIAVGGTPKSVIRAAMWGLPLAIAIIRGEPKRFAPLVRL